MNKQEKVLALIYTFYPNVDTSGNVFAKRLYCEIKKPTIVITNRYLSNPPLDESLGELVKPYLYKRIEIDSPFTYRDWNHFQHYIEGAINAYKSEVYRGEVITTIYSRSMSVITHIAAYLIKKENPNLKWIAEFSDPILKDVDGSERETVIPDEWIVNNHMKDLLLPFDKNRNLFFIAELIPYIFADEIIYTNDLQKEYMYSYFKESILDLNQKKTILDKVQGKSKVLSHPTLPPAFYKKNDYKELLDDEYINIGYFGNINANRNFNELFDAWLRLNPSKRSKIRLYIYTNMNAENILKKVPTILHPHLYVKKGLNYLDYLGILDRFSYLLTLDTKVNNIFGVNPFLPSKISDYLGANTKILSITETGSPVDTLIEDRIVKLYFGEVDLNAIF